MNNDYKKTIQERNTIIILLLINTVNENDD